MKIPNKHALNKVTKEVDNVIPAIPIFNFRINNQFKRALSAIELIATTKGVFESLNA